MTVVLAEDYYPPGCAPHPYGYDRMTLRVDGSGVGTFSLGAATTVEWIGGLSDTTGGGFGAQSGSVVLTAVQGDEVTGAFDVEMPASGGGFQQVTGSFDAVPAPVGAVY